ncbi:MAG: hypothetical protein IPJ88_17230 [Myxococcales bacterium]|nr:MAG: hypothetical protein IPJ88_17230 [Myxococcales bacterium]
MGKDSPAAKASRFLIRAVELLPWLLAWISILTLFIFYVIKFYRRVCYHFSRGRKKNHYAYRAALDVLSELRIRRHYGESQEAFARRLQQRYPSFRQLSDTHIATAFADPQRNLQASLPSALSNLRDERRQNVSWWRRLWALILPWSWLFSR